MFNCQINEINNDLKRTKRAIIALGCSFTQGQGAIDDELFDSYEWEHEEGNPLTIKVSLKDERRILKQYPLVTKNSDGILDFTFLEYENAFVNVLCKKYLNSAYTPINFGLRGCGNRATIKELYLNLNHKINLDKVKEKIVIYCPSGLERFDFVNDTYHDHFRWVCMWPHYESMSLDDLRRDLWKGYKTNIWSEKQQIIEQIANVQELVTWCKANDAKLIITPAFDKRYNKRYFQHILGQSVDRSSGKAVLINNSAFKKHPDIELIKLFPWEKMFYPNGNETFANLALESDEGIVDKQDHYFQFQGNRSPNGWITACAHPGKKAHDLFAKLLNDEIRSNKFDKKYQ